MISMNILKKAENMMCLEFTLRQDSNQHKENDQVKDENSSNSNDQ